MDELVAVQDFVDLGNEVGGGDHPKRPAVGLA
jgi:hypothetical protein